jgi:1-acyl-sn-glycerol-3-phosphate acyltransferase
MRFLGSLSFSLVMMLATIITALLLVLAAPTPFTVRSRIARAYAAFMVKALKILCGIDYVVTGEENIPPGAGIIFSNHQSTWETYALQLFFPPQVWVLKRELMWVPFFGWGLAMLKPIAIDRQAGRKAVKQITEQGKQRLQQGLWVTIFPEGTRIAPGQQKRWGMGGALLAADSGYPVVPVAHNAGEFWGRRQFIKQPGTIRVIIGEAIETRGKKAAEIQRQAEQWVQSRLSEISQGQSPEGN